jgi:hypothetical protein
MSEIPTPPIRKDHTMKIAPIALAFVAGAACALTLAAVQDSKGTKAAGTTSQFCSIPMTPTAPA